MQQGYVPRQISPAQKTPKYGAGSFFASEIQKGTTLQPWPFLFFVCGTTIKQRPSVAISFGAVFRSHPRRIRVDFARRCSLA